MINIHTFNDFRYRSSDKIGMQLNTCKQEQKINKKEKTSRKNKHA